jgi:hypothetical protein
MYVAARTKMGPNTHTGRESYNQGYVSILIFTHEIKKLAFVMQDKNI